MSLKRTHVLFVLTFLLSFLAALSAQTTLNVLNPASDLTGKTLVTAEGNRTISGTFTYTVPVLFATGTTGAPGIVGSADTTTGWRLSVGSIGASLGGVSRWVLDASGMSVYGNTVVNNAGNVPVGALNGGSGASASTFWRGDGTWSTATSDYSVCDLHLTLTSGLPYTTADVTAATTVYVEPVRGGRCGFYDGVSTWAVLVNVETTVSVPATTSTMYDIFCRNSAGTMACDATAWTNDTTRATNLSLQNNILVKSGDTTRRYVGSFRTTTVAGQTEDSLKKRYVWSYYNRANRALLITDATASWTYSTATWRQANANAANQLDFIVGVAEDAFTMTLVAGVAPAAGSYINEGIGEDSTSPLAIAQVVVRGDTAFASVDPTPAVVTITRVPAVGRHFYTWLEAATAAGTNTFYGTNSTVGVNTFTSTLSGLWRS